MVWKAWYFDNEVTVGAAVTGATIAEARRAITYLANIVDAVTQRVRMSRSLTPPRYRLIYGSTQLYGLRAAQSWIEAWMYLGTELHTKLPTWCKGLDTQKGNAAKSLTAVVLRRPSRHPSR